MPPQIFPFIFPHFLCILKSCNSLIVPSSDESEQFTLFFLPNPMPNLLSTPKRFLFFNYTFAFNIVLEVNATEMPYNNSE